MSRLEINNPFLLDSLEDEYYIRLWTLSEDRCKWTQLAWLNKVKGFNEDHCAMVWSMLDSYVESDLEHANKRLEPSFTVIDAVLNKASVPDAITYRIYPDGTIVDEEDIFDGEYDFMSDDYRTVEVPLVLIEYIQEQT